MKPRFEPTIIDDTITPKTMATLPGPGCGAKRSKMRKMMDNGNL